MNDEQRLENDIISILEQVETALETEAIFIKFYYVALTEQGLPKSLIHQLVRDYANARWAVFNRTPHK